MIKAVIFDLDGLLVDTEGLWKKTDIEFLKKRNINLNLETWDKIRGRGVREVIEFYKNEYGLQGEAKELVTKRRELFYSLANSDLKLLKGAEEIIKGLKEKGYLLAIATGGHTKEKTKLIISALGLYKYFDLLVSSDDVENGKPDPDIYLYAASLLGVNPSNCLVLEDAINGVLSGKRAKMRVFGVNKSSEFREQLEKAGADKVFSNLLEVLEFINK